MTSVHSINASVSPDALSAKHQSEKSALQVRLLKGPLYRAKHRELWQVLEREQPAVRDYFRQIGLTLRLDDAEGYAFLQQLEQDSDSEAGEPGAIEIPRLITRRTLTFAQTLLLVLVRKRLAEHDASDSSPRLIISRQEIHQWLTPFFAAGSNELKQQREFDALIKKTGEFGFLTQLANHPDEFEVQRIIKAVINAEQIGELLATLEQHASANSQQESSS